MSIHILKLATVVQKTGLSKSAIYRYISEGTFPKSIGLGARSVGWIDTDINDWLLSRIKNREAQ